MLPSLSKLTNALIWSTFMACCDMLWTVFNQESISASSTAQYFVITGLIYHFWAHGFIQRRIQDNAA